MTDDNSAPDDEWVFLRGSRGDDSMIARVRARGPSDEEREANPLIVLIQWPFDAGEDFLPDADLLDEMVAFETQIFEAQEADGWGVGIAVITTGGTREWRFYTHDLEQFQHGLNEALAGLPRYPLTFATFDDPDWDGYAEIAAAMTRG